MIAVLLMTLASAEPPDDLRPRLAPIDAPQQYAEYARSQGQSDVLACEPFWPEAALLCWQRGTGEWVTAANLREWQTSHEALVERATLIARERLAAGWTEVPVDGMTGKYFMAPDPDGWAHGAVLIPDVIASVTQTPTFYVTVPVQGVVLAWSPGDAELDHVIAVGAHKMFDNEHGPVTPVVFQYTGRWRAFAEAKPTATP